MPRAVRPYAVTSILTLSDAPLADFGTVRDSRTLPFVNELLNVTGLWRSDGRQMRLPAVTRAPVSLRVTGSENMNGFPAIGAGAPLGFPSTGLTDHPCESAFARFAADIPRKASSCAGRVAMNPILAAACASPSATDCSRLGSR